MIFKRNKPDAAAPEPQTKSGLFTPPKTEAAPGGLSTKAPAQEEPVTRDAVFAKAESQPAEPPTGWAVVISGSQRGDIFPLGYGQTLLKLSGVTDPAAIEYTAADRAFSLVLGGEKHELKANEDIEIGDHVLRLAPFCGAGFDWRSA